MKNYLCVCLFLVACTSLTAAEPSLKEARQLWLTGNYDEARERYEQFAKEAKNQPAAAIGISLTLQSQGEYDKALAILDDALKEHAKSAPLQARRAELLYLRGRWEEAEKAAQEALTANKNQFLAHWIIAKLAFDRGELKKADADFRWFVRTYNDRSQADDDVKDPEELLLVGLASTEYARMQSLADVYKFVLNDVYVDAFKNDKHFWPVKYQAGLMLLEGYNRGQALSVFDAALTINAQAAEVITAKGEASLMRMEFKEAEQFAEQALKINANLPEALRLRADIHLAVGDTKNALKELARAQKINDRDERTLARVATCFFLQKKKDELDKLKARILTFNSKPALFYYELGERLEERRHFDEAEKCYLEAGKLRAKMPGPSNSLGLLYMRMGKEKAAATLLNKGSKDDPFKNVRVENMLVVLRHLTKYETIKTKHYELRYDPKNDVGLARFMAEYLEEIHKELAGKFDYDPAGPILIELFNNHEMFSGRVVALPDLHTIGACTGRMIAMASPNGQGNKPFNWARVIRHEMVHIFNLEQTNFLVPHWLTEGLAVNNEGFPRPQPWNKLLLQRVPADNVLNLDTVDLGFIRPRDQDEWQLAYCQSQLYVQYLESKYGKAAVGEMLAAFREGLSTAAAIQKVCKVDKDTFEKGYKDLLQKTVQGMKSKPPEKRKSLEQLKKEYEKNPDDLEVTAALAEATLGKSAVEARKLASKVLDVKKNHPRACMVMAKLAKLGGDEKQAQELLERGLDRDDPDPRILLALGKMYYDLKDFDKAADVLELGRKAEPFESQWLEQLARVYAQTDNKDKHVAVLKELVPADADDLDRRKRLTRLLLEKEDYVEAEKYARQGLEINVKDKEVLESLQKALKGQKKDAEAERLMKMLEK